MPGMEGEPPACEKHLEPGAEIHRRRIKGDPDVTEIAGAVARRDVHATAQRDGKMGEVAAHSDPLAKCTRSRAVIASGAVVEPDLVVHEVADGLNPAPSGRGRCKRPPRKIRQGLRVAVPAAKKIDERVIGKLLDRRLRNAPAYFIR